MSAAPQTLTLEAIVAAADAIRALRPPPPSPEAIKATARFVAQHMGVDCAGWATPDGRIHVVPLAPVAVGDIIRAEGAIRTALGNDALNWIKIEAPRQAEEAAR